MEWARKIAKRYNTEHHEIVISERDAFNFFQTMVYHQDEPLADCVCVPLYYVSQLCKDSGVTVVQVGEGSDELFCGYGTYARYLDIYTRYWKPTASFIPAFAKKGVSLLASHLIANKPAYADAIHNWAYNKHFFWTGAMAFPESNKASLVDNQSYYDDPVVKQIYPELSLRTSYGVVEYHIQRMQKVVPNADFYTTMVYLELKQRLPELLLMRVDKMSMAASVEGRVPFLDHKLVEFALQIPTHFKYRNGITKYILKKAAEGILPHEIIYRKKMGFAAPTKRWFSQGAHFNTYFKDLLETRKTTVGNYLNMQEIHKIVAAHQAGSKDHSVQLWTLQNVIALDGMR
jgi:asparagine synthase (glutamine-hydrolysing)